MQLNVLRNITSMTIRGDDISTQDIGRQCPDVLVIWCGCSGGERL